MPDTVNWMDRAVARSGAGLRRVFRNGFVLCLKYWCDGAEPFNYSEQARVILRACVHKGEDGEDGEGDPMWDPETKLIKFVPETPFNDPSYHLPQDRAFWNEAASKRRANLQKACHPATSLSPEYAEL